MHWLYLALAIVFEIGGTTSMKLSEGLTKPVFTVLIFVLYGVSFVLFALAPEEARSRPVLRDLGRHRHGGDRHDRLHLVQGADGAAQNRLYRPHHHRRGRAQPVARRPLTEHRVEIPPQRQVHVAYRGLDPECRERSDAMLANTAGDDAPVMG